MKNRKTEAAHSKGFKMVEDLGERDPFDMGFNEVDYAKMRVGIKTLDDAVLKLGAFKDVNPRFSDKQFILRAIETHNYDELRQISNYFYESSGIYQRLCEYLAYLYKFDWVVVPYLNDMGKEPNKSLIPDFNKALAYLDNSNIKTLCGDIALSVIVDGAYYGYIVDFTDKFVIQQLPVKYCRSRFKSGTRPVVELNMKYFDDNFKDVTYRMRVLKMFPKDVQQGYVKFKNGLLVGDYPGDTSGWYMLDPNATVKFSIGRSEIPTLVGAIPSIIDLDAAQDLDRQKTMQQLLKIIIQRLPLDKNGDLIFDVDEARDIHNNAVTMLKRAVGVDVLTTFADIDVADMSDKNSATTRDDLAKVERTVFNNTGISQNLFNAEGNLALANSIANDEASMKNLKLQLETAISYIVQKFNKKNKYSFQVNILDTTIYNYKELSKLYKEQTQIGFSKVLPQVALGHSQSSIIATAFFENEILNLSEIMIPPMMSSTMSSKNLGSSNKTGSQENQNSIDQKETGRPEKSDDEKSDKTIANRESMA